MTWVSSYVFSSRLIAQHQVDILSEIFNNSEIKIRLYSEEFDADEYWDIIISFQDPADEAAFILGQNSLGEI